jgi:hypothetical protein
LNVLHSASAVPVSIPKKYRSGSSFPTARCIPICRATCRASATFARARALLPTNTREITNIHTKARVHVQAQHGWCQRREDAAYALQLLLQLCNSVLQVFDLGCLVETRRGEMTRNGSAVWPITMGQSERSTRRGETYWHQPLRRTVIQAPRYPHLGRNEYREEKQKCKQGQRSPLCPSALLDGRVEHRRRTRGSFMSPH